MTEKLIPPGSFGFPIIGETHRFVLDPYDFVKNRYKDYGSIFRTHLAGRPTAVMIGFDAAEFVLSTHMDHFSWRQGCRVILKYY